MKMITTIENNMKILESQQSLFIDYNGLEINTPKDVTKLQFYLENIFSKHNNFQVFVNYNNFAIKEECFEEFSKMCLNLKNHYKEAIRYCKCKNNEHSFFEALEKTVKEGNKEFCTDVFDIYLDPGFIVKSSKEKNINNCHITFADSIIKVGYNVNNGSEVAVKVFQKENNNMTLNLKKEIEIHKKLNHQK
jgi:hypothetical protein